MNSKNPPRRISALSLLLLPIAAFQFSCQRQDYRLEVVPGQQGQAEVRRVPFTAEEQASREREDKIRAALEKKSEAAVDTDLATLEALWPNLTPADRAAVLQTAKRAAAQQK